MSRRGARDRKVRRVLWITLVLNLAVSAAKLIVGSLTATLSLVADGYHSLLDGVGNVIGLTTLRFAQMPPDEDHQYGHRKFEVLAAMAISILLFATAFEILVEAWRRLHAEIPVRPPAPALVVAAATFCVNLFVTRYESRKGRALKSPLLLADAQHTMSDLYATTAVAAAIILKWAGIAWADPLAATGVAALIVVAGWRILTSGVDVVADRRVIDPGRVAEVVERFAGVRSCRNVRTRGFEDAVFLDLTVILDPALSLKEAHDMCDLIEDALQKAFPHLADIVIHPEPEMPGDTPATD
ncbi:MAG TPA: cation diffusion facilitator family transporter [Candidatus Saccharimonadales bacterium]|nr:cation diffusion facilitator family transporter [Candidatus Saccharimonadales bacterium]